jgi:hypothetical protein
MRLRLRSLAFASIVIVGMGIAPAATHAQAAEKPAEKPRVATPRAAKPSHCVQSLSPKNAPMTCYSSFRLAIAKATGGRITDAPDNVRIAMNDKRLLERLNWTGAKKQHRVPVRSTAAGDVVSIMYDEDSFRGDSIIYRSTHDCSNQTSDIEFTKEYVGDRWNDRMESYKTFRNCWVRLFEHRGFQGAFLDFAGDRTDFGRLHDEISSLQWS